ncbi:hypothetical protein [Rhodoferax sp.]|uniref:hypothetical protein n=1 Tax=Rhodoferax sp. TaxID=50421 RepID=UPI00374D0065
MPMPSLSAEKQTIRPLSPLRKMGFAVVFFLSGLAHELRHPLVCQSLVSRPASVWRKRLSL